MNKLRHSQSGNIRASQMMGVDFVFWVEGKTIDKFFYSPLIRQVLEPKKKKFLIRSASELPLVAQTEGKPRLILHHNELLNNGKLTSRLGTQKINTIFFMDKDIDDLLSISISSDHIVYTKYYNVENHLIRASKNHCKAIAACASVDEEGLAQNINFDNLIKNIHKNWKYWITYCLTVRMANLPNPNFGSQSPLNSPCHGVALETAFNQLVARARPLSSPEDVEFDEVLQVNKELVDRYIDTDRIDEIFNGKWYSCCIFSKLNELLRGQSFDGHEFERRIMSHIAQTLNFEEPWISYFTEKLQALSDL